jgi:hypothetical protein
MAKKRTIIVAGLGLLLVIAGVSLYFFGPASGERSICRICGKYRVQRARLGVTWYDRERENNLSTWYRQVGMRLHSHQWTPLSSWVQYWGGVIECSDWFGFEVEPLWRLKDATERVDQATAEHLVREYEATEQEPAKKRAFFERYRKILDIEEESRPRDP